MKNHQNYGKALSLSCIHRSDPVLYRFQKKISQSPTCRGPQTSKPFGDRPGIYMRDHEGMAIIKKRI